ncbi:hypothetical protein ACT691_20015 [Vibrio metschnikovii]
MVCLESDEAHVRALLLQGVLRLCNKSEKARKLNQTWTVRVISSVMATQRTDSHIERIGRLSLELTAWRVGKLWRLNSLSSG